MEQCYVVYYCNVFQPAVSYFIKLQLRSVLACKCCYLYKLLAGLPMKIFLNYIGCNTGISHYPFLWRKSIALLPVWPLHKLWIEPVNAFFFHFNFHWHRTKIPRGNRARLNSDTGNIFFFHISFSLTFPIKPGLKKFKSLIKVINHSRMDTHDINQYLVQFLWH